MYRLNGENSVTRLSDGACIPFVNGNRDYEEYKQWVDNGGVTAPEFTAEELIIIDNALKTSEALDYLASTDWVTSKYNDEVTVAGSITKANFLAKYQEIYTLRAAARNVINSGV